MTPDRIFLLRIKETGEIGCSWHKNQLPSNLFENVEYVRKDMVVDAIKLAYGTVSMNPFDCSEAFEELLKKVNHEIH